MYICDNTLIDIQLKAAFIGRDTYAYSFVSDYDET
jgi:hypothetical protein